MDNDINESVKIETSDVEKKTEKVTTEPKPVHQRDRKHGKEEKPRKKEERGVEQVLKSLGSIENTDEKISAMCKKYSEVIDENRKLQLALKQSEKKVQMIQREKEQLQTERSKAVLTRSRLESLCRELQRHNKAVKEESLLKLREEEEKRKEVSAKFQSTLAEITTLMSQNNEKNAKLHEDNMEMSKNFKSVCEQVELREQQFEKIHQQMKLENQLAEAKLAKVTLEMTADKESLLNEKKQLLSKLTECQMRIKEMQAQEVGLRSQISMYTDKYDEFQNALTKSNQVFGGFNEEMEKMSKKIQKLEKETGLWKQRWEKSHQALLEMAADKQARDAEIEGLNRKRLLFLELCKAFQQERTTLIAQLKEKTVDSNATQNETSENTKSIEQIDNLTKGSEKLGNSLSQAEESLMQDIASQEAKKKGLNSKPKVEQPPIKAESAKRKEKKKQKGNDNIEVKKEAKEKEEDLNLKEKVSEEKTPSNKQESSEENKETVGEDKESTDKDKETINKGEEVIEKENQDTIVEKDSKPIETENTKDDISKPKSEDNLEQFSDPGKLESNSLDLNEELKETSVSNSDKNANQVPADVEVQVSLENKTEDINGKETIKSEITEEIVQSTEAAESTDLNDKTEEQGNLENKPISELNYKENGENVEGKEHIVSEKSELVLEKTETAQKPCEVSVLANQENVQIKSDSCPTSGKKGKEAKRKKK